MRRPVSSIRRRLQAGLAIVCLGVLMSVTPGVQTLLHPSKPSISEDFDLVEYYTRLNIYYLINGVKKKKYEKKSTISDIDNELDKLKVIIQNQKSINIKNNEINIAILLEKRGNLFLENGEIQRANESFDQALRLYINLGDDKSKARMLLSIGKTYFLRGVMSKAQWYFQMARSGSECSQDERCHGLSLLEECRVKLSIGDRDGARQLLNTSLTNHPVDTDLRIRIGLFYMDLGDYIIGHNHIKDAWMEYNKNNFSEELSIEFGKSYYKMGDNVNASKIFKLSKVSSIINNNIDSIVKSNIYLSKIKLKKNLTNMALNQLNESRRYFNSISPAVLVDLGETYLELGERKQANDLFQKAQNALHNARDRWGESRVLLNLARIHRRREEWDSALSWLYQALPLLHHVGDQRGEAETLALLMDVWHAKRFPRLAIFYGKLSINIFQNLRNDVNIIGSSEVNKFTKSIESVYRKLAGILIVDNRLLESQQIIDLLKKYEFSNIIRGNHLKNFDNAELDRFEEDINYKIRMQSENIFKFEQERKQIVRKAEVIRTSIEVKRLKELDNLLEEELDRFQRILRELETLFRKDPNRVQAEDRLMQSFPQAEAFANTLKRLREATGQEPVAVRTLVGEKSLRFIVVSADNVVTRETTISAADLDRKVSNFREALQNYKLDPRPLAKELYDILIGPIEDDLNQAEADVTMWSLDGSLRYLPVAALSPDGESYLVESERVHCVYTPASVESSALTHPDKEPWKALVLAMALKAEVKNGGETLNFEPLTGAQKEALIIEALLPKSTILLNKDFTLSNMKSKQQSLFSVMHIASHFYLHASGDEERSFLLLGDGTALTLADIRRWRLATFGSIDLLALSACETALGAGHLGTGAEMEGFGDLVQRKGARAVLASLWRVDDPSTTALMQQFYKLHEKDPKRGKARCLRDAQLALLRGQVTIPGGVRGPESGATNGSALPRFTPPANAKAAHPYYWAPFILMGNWN